MTEMHCGWGAEHEGHQHPGMDNTRCPGGTGMSANTDDPSALLAAAVEAARTDVLNAGSQFASAFAAQRIYVVRWGQLRAALKHYGDLKALEGRWKEHQTWAHDGDDRCYVENATCPLEAEIRAAIGGTDGA